MRPFNCVGVGEGRALGEVEVLSRQREAGDEPRRARPRAEDRSRARTRCTSSATATRSGTTPTAATWPAASSTAMEHPRRRNEDFNLSTAESTTVLELAELIWRKIKGAGRAVPLRVATTPFEHDVQKRVPDDRRRPSEVLGFEATTTPRRDARRGHPVDRAGHRGRHDLTGRDPQAREVPAPIAPPSFAADARGGPARRRRTSGDHHHWDLERATVHGGTRLGFAAVRPRGSRRRASPRSSTSW